VDPHFSSVETVVIHRSRLADYVALTKPELTTLSVLTAVGAAFLASSDPIPYSTILHVLFGTFLVGGGAGALNQVMERKFDAAMKRTANRPVPAGRVSPVEATVFGTIISGLGILELTLGTNPLAGFLAFATLATYLLLYTPLKRLDPISTVVGGLPGALPPVIGWCAVRGNMSIEPLALAAILFFWQIPHFLSLAWMYRKDYARAGYRVLAAVDPDGKATGRQILIYAGALIPASILPTWIGLAGLTYLLGALVTGVAFLLVGFSLYRNRSNVSARRLFIASLAYLPLITLFFLVDRFLR
jgi:protoheme IX farnesyltransferase